jgi:cell division protein FtsB
VALPRLRRPARLGRLLGVAVVCAIAVGYVQPVRSYMEAEADVVQKRAERSALLRQQARLRELLELAETDAFVEREARRLQLVRPGETLYFVKGINRWKREAAERARAAEPGS